MRLVEISNSIDDMSRRLSDTEALAKSYRIALEVLKKEREAIMRQECKPDTTPSRRSDWHYDSQGYCDNPGRGY